MAALAPYEPDAHKLYHMKAVGGSLLIISSIAVCLRIWTRTRIVRCWGWDDWMILPALAFYIGEYVVIILLADVEFRPLDIPALDEFAALICCSQVVYLAATIFLKISLACFFLRFLVERWARYVVWLSVIVYSLVATSAALLITFECGIPGNYTMKETKGECVSWTSLKTIIFAYGSLNALTDWVFPLLALHFLCRTRMSRMAKISCSAILLLAVVGSVASIARTVYIPGFGPGGNLYVNSAKPLIWSLIEGGLGITAASMATLRPLFQRCSARTKTIISSARSKDSPSRGKVEKSATQESDLEKCDTMNMEPRIHVRTKPLHLGILSSVMSEAEGTAIGRIEITTEEGTTKSAWF